MLGVGLQRGSSGDEHESSSPQRLGFWHHSSLIRGGTQFPTNVFHSWWMRQQGTDSKTNYASYLWGMHSRPEVRYNKETDVCVCAAECLWHPFDRQRGKLLLQGEGLVSRQVDVMPRPGFRAPNHDKPLSLSLSLCLCCGFIHAIRIRRPSRHVGPSLSSRSPVFSVLSQSTVKSLNGKFVRCDLWVSQTNEIFKRCHGESR